MPKPNTSKHVKQSGVDGEQGYNTWNKKHKLSYTLCAQFTSKQAHEQQHTFQALVYI